MQSKKDCLRLTNEKKIRVGCPAHNCGGRCLLVAHVREGRIVRLDSDDRPDTVAAPQLRACVRGRSYLRRQYHPDRLTQPLRRAGPRGSGEFRPISWEEALDTLASQMERIKRSMAHRHCLFPMAQVPTIAERIACCPALDESVWRLPGNLQFVFLGRNQSGNTHRLWHARHRQPASGLAELRNTS